MVLRSTYLRGTPLTREFLKDSVMKGKRTHSDLRCAQKGAQEWEYEVKMVSKGPQRHQKVHRKCYKIALKGFQRAQKGAMGHTRGVGVARKGQKVKVYIPSGSEMGPKSVRNPAKMSQNRVKRGFGRHPQNTVHKSASNKAFRSSQMCGNNMFW